MIMKLECTQCRNCLSISEWNDSNVYTSLYIGAIDQLIPITLNFEEWEKYKEEHSGPLFCPICDEISQICDMDAY